MPPLKNPSIQWRDERTTVTKQDFPDNRPMHAEVQHKLKQLQNRKNETPFQMNERLRRRFAVDYRKSPGDIVFVVHQFDKDSPPVETLGIICDDGFVYYMNYRRGFLAHDFVAADGTLWKYVREMDLVPALIVDEETEKDLLVLWNEYIRMGNFAR